MFDSQKTYVGIDVSKRWGDVAVRPSGESWRFIQDLDGIRDLVSRLAALEPTLVAVEPTGRYERALAISPGSRRGCR